MDNIRLNTRFKSFNQPKVKAFTLAEVSMAKRMSGKENKVLFSRESKPKEPTNKIKKLVAFTLAEVLITLVIIGVVAALTIPSVITSYKDKQYNTARLKALHTFGDAGKMASVNNEINGQPTAKDFAQKILSKYLKIAKVCDTASDCGFPDKIVKANKTDGELISDSMTWANIGDPSSNYFTDFNQIKYTTYLSTADGFSAKLFYNPNCARNSHEAFKYASPTGTCKGKKECAHNGLDSACINIIYDMNGIKAPNHAGEDIGFVTIFWSGLKASATAPDISYNINADYSSLAHSDAQIYCASKSTNKIKYTLPSLDEATSLLLNRNISSMPAGKFWSGSAVSEYSDIAWYVNEHGGHRFPNNASTSNGVWCIRR